MSDFAFQVNEGHEVQLVQKVMEHEYVLYSKILQVWKFGDPSNRKRLFIVGFKRTLGQAAHEFVWPQLRGFL